MAVSVCWPLNIDSSKFLCADHLSRFSRVSMEAVGGPGIAQKNVPKIALNWQSLPKAPSVGRSGPSFAASSSSIRSMGVVEEKEELTFDSIRESLIQQEDSIIYNLLEGAQYCTNPPTYVPGFFPIQGSLGSLVRYLLKETERLHASRNVIDRKRTAIKRVQFDRSVCGHAERVRRYTSPDEHAFFPNNLSEPLLPPMSYPKALSKRILYGKFHGNVSFTVGNVQREKRWRRNQLRVCNSVEDLGAGQDYHPVVKMCGVTIPEDAAFAAQAGALYVGMIIWPKSKRSVSLDQAREICAAVREFGAEPVGVFVDETAAQIEKACDVVGLSFAQLHGEGARASALQLPSSLKTICVMHADPKGCLQTIISPEMEKIIDWVLVDGLEGGSGVKFDWKNFQVPELALKKGWFLAGGLTPDNVSQAVKLLRPNAVDVSSGITGPDGIRKDRNRILAFMEAVRLSASVPIQHQL